jgi:hypothetical protein
MAHQAFDGFDLVAGRHSWVIAHGLPLRFLISQDAPCI